MAGHNHISKILDGCVVFENWTSAASTFAGQSFNTYDPVSATWNQTWVDTGGATIHFSGRRKGNIMHLAGTHTDGKGRHEYLMTYTLNADGTVRQLWRQSDDNEQWTTIFDGLYKRSE